MCEVPNSMNRIEDPEPPPSASQPLNGLLNAVEEMVLIRENMLMLEQEKEPYRRGYQEDLELSYADFDFAIQKVDEIYRKFKGI